MIRPLDWDSRHFQCRIGRVEGETPETDPSFDCLYFLADAGNSVARQQALGLSFVEMGERVRLHSAELEALPGGGVRAAQTEDVDTLAAIEYPETRFALDTHFPRERVAAMYRHWTEKLIASTFVAIEDGAVAGYVACDQEAPKLRISLIGVVEEFRGRGVASRLLNGARVLASQRGLRGLTVITQASNDAALRLYHRHGFREVSRQTWFHWWRA